MSYRSVRILLLLITILMLGSCSSGGGNNNGSQNATSQGTISGVVRDAQSQAPLDNASIIVSDEDGNVITTITTNANGEFSVTLDVGPLYSLLISIAGYMQSAYFNIDVTPNTTQILQTVLQIDLAFSAGTGSVSGTILNATTGLPIVGATLRFRQGINVFAGTPDAETTTDAAGFYLLSDALAAGNYTCEIILAGYVTTYAQVVVLGGLLVGEQNSAISIAPASGETRIVLTWGATPSDLDSHVTGPITNNSLTRFHVYWAIRNYPDALSPETNLDVDDITSFGPETITIIDQHEGTYRYSVHDYTNGTVFNTPNSMGLATSGARVEVIRSGQPTQVFNVPNLAGTLWTVFELNGNNIIPINNVSDESDPFVIQSISKGKTDAELIRQAPLK